MRALIYTGIAALFVMLFSHDYEITGTYKGEPIKGEMNLNMEDSTVLVTIDNCCASKNNIVRIEQKDQISIFVLDDHNVLMYKAEEKIYYRAYGYLIETK